MPRDDDYANMGHPASHRHVRTMGEFSKPQVYKAEPGEEDAESVAKQLVNELLAGATSEREMSKRLDDAGKEPEHPLIAACVAWARAIQQRNGLSAEEAVQKTEKAMKMYQNRPAFTQLVKHLQRNHPLSAENLPWLKELVKKVREGL